MKRINILLGGQGHALMVKGSMASRSEIHKYGNRYLPRVYLKGKIVDGEAVEDSGEAYELYVWDQVPEFAIPSMAENAISRGFVSER